MRFAGMSWRDYALSTALLTVALVYTAMTVRFGAASRAVPQIIGGATIVLCLCDIVSRSDTEAGRHLARWLNPAGRTEPVQPRYGRQAAALGGVAALVLAMTAVGLLAPVAAFCLVALRYGARQGWIRSVAMAAGLTGLIWLLFTGALGLTLFPGLMFGGDW